MIALDDITSLENWEITLFGTAKREKKYYPGQHLRYLKNILHVYWKIKIWTEVINRQRQDWAVWRRGRGKKKKAEVHVLVCFLHSSQRPLNDLLEDHRVNFKLLCSQFPLHFRLLFMEKWVPGNYNDCSRSYKQRRRSHWEEGNNHKQSFLDSLKIVLIYLQINLLNYLLSSNLMSNSVLGTREKKFNRKIRGSCPWRFYNLAKEQKSFK